MPVLADDPVERLIAAEPYGCPWPDRRQRLLAAMQQAYAHHFRSCPGYQRYCRRRGWDASSRFESLEQIPYLPVQAFKENIDLLQSVAPQSIKTRLQSSATSGLPSTVAIDRVTARRQVRALASVMAAVLGSRRRRFLVVDEDPQSRRDTSLGARGAAVRGFLNLARQADYFMRDAGAGQLQLDEQRLAAALESMQGDPEPVVLFGFTFVLYADVVRPMREAARRFPLPPGSHVIHIGGWKKLEDQKVARDQFNRDVGQVFGVAADHVIDFYGFTEQMGVTYPDGPDGEKCAPVFADVIVRHPETFEPVPDGEPGLLEFLTPLPHSYPGIAVLTDDMGVVTSRDSAAHGWHGTRFRVLGRAKQAEVRGCGDIMGEKVARPRRSGGAAGPDDRRAATARRTVRLLFGDGRRFTPSDPRQPVRLDALPVVEDLPQLGAQLRESSRALGDYGVDERIALVAAAARRWMSDPALAPLRQQGLLFLSHWCRSTALRETADLSLRGERGFLDGFRPVGGTHRRMLKAVPRGLVGHWLSGNVPLLGMLALVQSIAAGNANILKAASSFSSVLPTLLDAFHGLEVRTRGGRLLRGDDLLGSLAVVYFERDHRDAAEAFSEQLDVRLAWGGREAVQAILDLPRRWDSEDIVFGPKLSYMVVGRERLATPRLVRRTARGAATDASVFDQYACASPHTIFVERGGATAGPEQFAEQLSHEMERALKRIPKTPADAGTAGRINRLRIRYELSGQLWASPGSEWTVLFDEDGEAGLAEPCYSRVITVRAVDDIMQAARFTNPDIQTIGLGLDGPRRLAFADQAAARGAARFPDIGRMTFFDSPWDGLYAMDRLVRWISLGGPLNS